MSDKMKIVLQNSSGRRVICRTEIYCTGEPPPIVTWDDSPDGERSFVHVGDGIYNEQPAYILSLGEVIPRKTAKVRAAEPNGDPPAPVIPQTLDADGLPSPTGGPAK